MIQFGYITASRVLLIVELIVWLLTGSYLIQEHPRRSILLTTNLRFEACGMLDLLAQADEVCLRI